MNVLFSFVVAPRKQHIDLEGKWIDEAGMGAIVRTIVKCLDTASLPRRETPSQLLTSRLLIFFLQIRIFTQAEPLKNKGVLV